MTRARQLAATLTEIFEGDPWYAPSVKAALDGITAVAAAAQPITGAHTIWEITAHMDAWNQVCLRRLAGEVCVEPDVNFAEPDEISPNAWRRLREICLDDITCVCNYRHPSV